MTRISAADNLVINTAPNQWQLLINTDFVEHVQGDGLLMEAVDAQPLRFTSAFARTRHLPKSGELSTHYIQRVVLGWNWEDEAWHLGLMLENPLAQVRGSRWCEIARWPDPEQDVFKDLAIDAGRTLARIIERPFNLVPVREKAIPLAQEPKPLPELPIEVQGWHFERASSNGWLSLVRDGTWARERMRRVLWYSFWTVIYLLLSAATLLSDIALPRPEFLPYLGLATAVLLIGLVIYNMWELRRKPRRIIVDPQTHHIWSTPANETAKPLWRMSREKVDSVYVSHVVKERDQEQTLQYGEVNLRLTNGKFYFLFNQSEATPLNGRLSGSEDILLLDQDKIQTKLQAVGFYIGNALDVPVWYDHRK